MSKKIGINIRVGRRTVKEVGRFILKILTSKADQTTMQTALTVLGQCSSVRDTNLSGNCVKFEKEE